MELIDELTRRVELAVAEIAALRVEKKQMESELALLREQLRKQSHVNRENERLKKDLARVRVRLEKLDAKIQTYLTTGETVSTGAVT
jgi:outer membrane usher protein FimD/PapC